MKPVVTVRTVKRIAPVVLLGLAACAPSARADEALQCDDKRIIAKLNSGYSNPENIASKRIDKPREMGYGSPPAALKAMFDKARYCEANVVLANGGSDTIYYRLNVLKGGKVQDWVEPCFKKLNDKSMLADGCVDHRPGK